jgi:predicted XRE-type DNA-binding protein
MAVEHERSKEYDVTASTGNVFEDLGISQSDEDKMKVAIAHAITNTIRIKNLTQVQAGSLMGENQARVSDLTRGRLDRFSVAKLIECLLALGRDIHIDISAKVRTERGRLKVRAA